MQFFLGAGALAGVTGVLLGAFGAHALKSRLVETSLSAWDTAVQYQLVHALALVLVAVLMRTAASGNPSQALTVAGWSFLVGILLFSGSLYVLALGGPRLFGPITPIGGLAFLAGWMALLVAAWR